HVWCDCSEKEVVQTPNYPQSSDDTSVWLRSTYLASESHYEAVAGRILAALWAGARFVLLTGASPSDSQILARALGKSAGSRYAVVIIACGPKFTREDLERTLPALAMAKPNSGAVAQPGCSAAASPLFVFDDFDRLSDKQIGDVCQAALRQDQAPGAAV